MSPEFLERPGYPTLAYHRLQASDKGKNLPSVMFLGGYRSDMEGTKAMYLENKCRERGQAYVRFDYSGHGSSGGEFKNGTISSWKEDALAILDNIVGGPVILVGSSMGGWVSLLVAKERSDLVKGFVGIAAAPDFTRGLFESFDESQKQELETEGFVSLPNDYSNEPYIFTKSLIEDGEKNCLLDYENELYMPVRLIQGMQDHDVPWQTAYRIKNAISGDDVDVLPVESGDHRLSQPENLELIDSQVRLLSEKF